jgi:MFS family permease
MRRLNPCPVPASSYPSILRTFASSAPSGILPQMMEHFGFGIEVATLTVSLFIAGYCLGPLLWGPLSEDVCCFFPFLSLTVVQTFSQIGRRPVFLISFFFYTVWSALVHIRVNSDKLSCLAGVSNWLRALSKHGLHPCLSIFVRHLCCCAFDK